MAEIIRLNKVLRELNISLDRAVDFLETKNVEIEKRPTTKITSEVYDLLAGEFQTDASKKVASKEVGEAKLKEKEALRLQREQEIELKLKKSEAAKTVIKTKQVLQGPKKVGKIDLEGSKKTVQQPSKEIKPVVAPKEPATTIKPAPKVAHAPSPTPDTKEKPVSKSEPTPPATPVAPTEPVATKTEAVNSEDKKVETTNYQKLSGPKSTGQKIDLAQFNKPKKEKPATPAAGANSADARKKRRRISKVGSTPSQPRGNFRKRPPQARTLCKPKCLKKHFQAMRHPQPLLKWPIIFLNSQKIVSSFTTVNYYKYRALPLSLIFSNI